MRTHPSSKQLVVALSLLVFTSGCVRHGWPTLKAGASWDVVHSDGSAQRARVSQGQSAPFPAYLEDAASGAAIQPSAVRELRKPLSPGFVVGGVLLGLLSGALVGGVIGDAVGRSRPPSGPFSFDFFGTLIDVLVGSGVGALVGGVLGGTTAALLDFPVRYVIREGSAPEQSLSLRPAE